VGQDRHCSGEQTPFPSSYQSGQIQESDNEEPKDVGELQGRHEVADQNQGGRGTEKGATVLVQDGDGWGAAQAPAEQGPAVVVADAQGGGWTRQMRSPKPNTLYSPEVYDLSYAGVRTRSKKSIRRAGISTNSVKKLKNCQINFLDISGNSKHFSSFTKNPKN
jgi:hypothetical protein